MLISTFPPRKGLLRGWLVMVTENRFKGMETRRRPLVPPGIRLLFSHKPLMFGYHMSQGMKAPHANDVNGCRRWTWGSQIKSQLCCSPATWTQVKMGHRRRASQNADAMQMLITFSDNHGLLWSQRGKLIPTLPFGSAGSGQKHAFFSPRFSLHQMWGLNTLLVVQWLRLPAASAGGWGLIPGWGIKIPRATRCSQKRFFKWGVGGGCGNYRLRFSMSSLLPAYQASDSDPEHRRAPSVLAVNG